MLHRLINEPLIHFLLLSVLLFAIYAYIENPEDNQQQNLILVDQDSLLSYMQHQAKTFDPQRFKQILNNLPADKLESLIDSYVQEESLYREAKALNLDKNDYIARRRLIQQLQYITQGFTDTNITISEKELQDHLQANRDNYYQPAEITFTHVFFSTESRKATEAESTAKAKLRQLNQLDIPFHQAMAYGDRFLYHINYVKKQPDEIASHFGQTMQQQVFALAPENSSQWQGPFRSPYGFHLVKISHYTKGFHPALADIRQKVEQDVLRARKKENLEKTIKAIVGTYEVELDSSIQTIKAQAGAS